MSIMDDLPMRDLLNPHFEIQGGRLFIIGTVPLGSTKSDWCANHLGAVAWDRVTDYFLFDSLEDYTKAIRKSESGKKKKK